MPVTFDNSNGTQSTGTLCNMTLTVGSNAVLLVAISNNSTSNFSVSAMAYAGAAMTRLGQARGFGTGIGWPLELWGLTAPTAGVGTLSCQFTGSDLWFVTGASYLNVAGVNPFGTIGSATATSSSVINLSLSSTSTDLCVMGCIGSQTITLGNSTQRVAQTVILSDAAGVGPTKSISASLAVAGSWIAIGVSLRFSASAVTQRFFRALTGVGY